ncbi:MAG: DUF1961 family protein [Pedobacter sp.]|uniref:DUF1961 family protein n=1 Tax=Pedobacter sp. TaxID=1411316 RepID=UPI003565A62B
MKAWLTLILYLVVFSSSMASEAPFLKYQSGSFLDTVLVGADKYEVKWLIKENFNDNNWKLRWEVETTDAIIKVSNGKLFITDHGIGTTLWNKMEFPKNLIVKYRVRAEGKKEDNKTNFNLFSHAKGIDGKSLVVGKESKRTGAYNQYHNIPNYISTFTFKHSRIRKDPGFILLSDSKEYSVTDKIYQIVYAVSNGHIRYYVDGKKIHDVIDDTPLEGGKIGIRTWDTEAWWDDIEIGMIVGKIK